MANMNLNRIATFVRVVEAGSFTAAARNLSLPISSVSRSVSRLEEDLGVRLLQRTTRKLSLTEAGQQYYEGVRGALGALEDAGAAASQASREPRGTVRVTVPADFGGRFFMDVLNRFLGRHERVHVDVLLTNRRVHLVEEGVDLALRAGVLDDSSLMSRRIGETELGLYASRRYLEERGTPRTLGQLARHDCVLFRASGGVVRWRLTGPRGQEEVEVSGRLTLDSLTAVREAIAAGAGIGTLPVLRLPGEAVRGADTLVRILPRYAVKGSAVHLVWPSSRFLPRHVALFRDFLAAELANVARPL